MESLRLASLPPFLVGEARQRFGLGRARLETALRRREVVPLGVGVLVGADRLAGEPADVHAQHVLAAQLRLSGVAAASFGSAALLHDLDRLGRPSGRVRLTREGARYRKLDVAAVLHTAGLPAEHLTEVRGVLATTRARTVVDLARRVTPRSGVVVADSAMRQGCSRDDLQAVLDYCRRWPGRRRAVAVVDFADPRSESALESVSRVLFREAGIPAPELQWSFDDDDGTIGRVDFYWEEFRVVGEADGMKKYDEPGAGRREKLREMRLEDIELEVVRWTWDEIWRQPDVVLGRLRRAMNRGRYRAA
jgi:hypothetical protein